MSENLANKDALMNYQAQWRTEEELRDKTYHTGRYALYGIYDLKRIFVEEGDHDSFIVIELENNHPLEPAECIKYFANHDGRKNLREFFEKWIEEDPEFHEALPLVDDDTLAHPISDDTLHEFIKAYLTFYAMDDKFIFRYYIEPAEFLIDRIFFTEKEAQEHLKNESHHYSPAARVYATHPWRADETVALLQALQDIDFEHSLLFRKDDQETRSNLVANLMATRQFLRRCIKTGDDHTNQVEALDTVLRAFAGLK